jgi:hypothetical protein
MDIFIVYLRSAQDDFEDAAVVVAESKERAIRRAKCECSFPVADDDIECIQICDEEPCIYWFV